MGASALRGVGLCGRIMGGVRRQVKRGCKPLARRGAEFGSLRLRQLRAGRHAWLSILNSSADRGQVVQAIGRLVGGPADAAEDQEAVEGVVEGPGVVAEDAGEDAAAGGIATAAVGTRFLEGPEERAGLAVFWAVRLWMQWFLYDAQLWRGKTFETLMHFAFTGLWLLLVVTFSAALVHSFNA